MTVRSEMGKAPDLTQAKYGQFALMRANVDKQ
jgi:hypothetical protein